jgi:polysaccharide export outer membrane protein
MSAKFLLLVFIVTISLVPALAISADQSTIGPGDTLKITVLGEPDQSKQVVVDDDGRISLPLVKDFQVSGLTTSAAADAIAEKLKAFIKNPDVTVEMAAKALKRVTLNGQVKTPGVYPIERGTRLMQVIGLAGGLLESANTSGVSVTRSGQAQPITCNLQTFIAGGDEAANVVLQDGDVVTVPERTPAVGTVFVYGAVKTPGQPIVMREGMRVSQAVSAAGGILPDQADPNRAALKHEGQADSTQIDLAKALSGDQTADLVLKHGDTITIPTVEKTGTYTVFGAVTNSGEFPLRSNMTVTNALALASVANNAKVTDVRLTRNDSAGKSQAIKVDVKRVSSGQDTDVALQPGDTIYVPQQAQRDLPTRWLAIGVSIIGILLRR